MKKIYLILFFIGLYLNIHAQNTRNSINLFENQLPIQKVTSDTTKRFPPRKYLELMQTPSANFFDIVKEAETYFTIRGTGKGTGYKQYMRWKTEMRPFYDESGQKIDMVKVDKSKNEYIAKAAANSPAARKSVQTPWKELGPFDQVASQGKIEDIAVYAVNPLIIYSVADGGGAWKTIDGGKNWITLTDRLKALDFSAVAVDPSNPNVVVIGSGRSVYSENSYISTNGGIDWQPCAGILPYTYFYKIRYKPSNPEIVYACSNNGMYRSIDKGRNWTRLSFQSVVYDFEFNPIDDSIIYISNTNTIWKSMDSGNTFFQLYKNVLLSDNSYSLSELAVTLKDPNRVYFLTAKNDGNFGTLFLSRNSGNSFEIVNDNLTMLGDQTYYNIGLAVSSENSDVVACAGVAMVLSFDGGKTFPKEANFNKVHVDFHALDFVGKTLYMGTDGGVHTWDNLNEEMDASLNLKIHEIYRLSNYKPSKNLIVIGAQDNGTRLFEGKHWGRLSGGDGMTPEILTENQIATSIQGGEVIYNPTSATKFMHSLGNSAWITQFKIKKDEPKKLYRAHENLYLYDTETSTHSIIYDAKNDEDKTIPIGSFEIAESNPNYFYFSKQISSTIHVSSDKGNTWVKYKTPINPPNNREFEIDRIFIHPSKPNQIAVTVYQTGVFLESLNFGQTWTIQRLATSESITALQYEGGIKEGIYIGTTSGVYYKNKDFSDWIPYMEGLPAVQISDIKINPCYNKIHIATYGRGVWENNTFENLALKTTLNVTTNSLCKQLTVPINNPNTEHYWLKDGLTQKRTFNQNNFLVNNEGFYEVFAISDGYCYRDSIRIQKASLAGLKNFNISSNSSGIICNSSFTDLAIPYDSQLSYQWYKNKIVLKDSTKHSLRAFEAGQYKVKVSGVCMTEEEVEVTIGKVDAYLSKPNASNNYMWVEPNSTQKFIVNYSGTAPALITIYNGEKSIIYEAKTNPFVFEVKADYNRYYYVSSVQNNCGAFEPRPELAANTAQLLTHNYIATVNRIEARDDSLCAEGILKFKIGQESPLSIKDFSLNVQIINSNDYNDRFGSSTDPCCSGAIKIVEPDIVEVDLKKLGRLSLGKSYWVSFNSYAPYLISYRFKFVVSQLPNSPTITSSISQPVICPGNSVTLTASSCSLGNILQWSTGVTTSSITVKPINSVTYTASCLNPEGCKGSTSYGISVMTAPKITVSGNLCADNNLLLNATGLSLPSLQWMRDGQPIANANSATHIANQAGTYSVENKSLGTWISQNPIPTGVNFQDVQFLDNQIGYTVGEKGVIYKTTDGGKEWMPQNSGITNTLYDVHFTDANTGWAIGNYVLIKTIDGGLTWKSLPIGEESAWRSVYFTNANNGYIVSENMGGLRRTTDGGNTWTIPTGIPNDIPLLSIHFINTTTGWVVGNNGTILKTIDGGSNWTAQMSGTLNHLSSVFFVDSNNGWATFNSYSGSILKTTDGGLTWTATSLFYGKYSKIQFVSKNQGYLVGYNHLLRTQDGGITWTYQNYYFPKLFGLHFISNLEGLIVGEGGYISKTTDGGNTWSDIFGSGIKNQINDITFVTSQTGWVVGEWGLIARTDNGGNTWKQQSSNTPQNLSGVYFVNANTGWGVGWAIVNTTNGGDTWVVQNGTVSSLLMDVFFINSTTGWAVGNDGLIMATTNGGTTWTTQTSGTTMPLFKVHFVNNSVGWIVGGNGTILKTTNGGVNWVAQNSNTASSLHGLFFSDANNGWVGGNNMLLHTNNGGATWIAVNTIGQNFEVRDIQFFNTNDGWFSSFQGGFYTHDGGSTWSLTEGNENLNKISFMETNIGWAIGSPNKIFKFIKPNLACTSIPITVQSSPDAPNVNSSTINSGQTATLTASNCAGTVKWYDATTGGNTLGTGSSYTTPVLSVTTIYYASCTVNDCESTTRVSAVVTVNGSSPCPPTITHTGSIASGTYSASGTIVSTVNVPNNTKYYAGQSVTLSPGFSAGPNENFEVRIQGCTTTPTAQTPPPRID